MSSITTQVWTDALDALIDQLPHAVEELQATSAARLLDTAKALCPVDTGRLRESGHIDDSNPLGPQVIFDTEYAYWVHYGTRHQAAQPWLATAVDVETPHYLNAVRVLVEDAARQAGGRRA
jgi:hypothetical protein